MNISEEETTSEKEAEVLPEVVLSLISFMRNIQYYILPVDK